MAFRMEKGQLFGELESTGLEVGVREGEKPRMTVRFPAWVIGGCGASFMGM